MSTLAAIAVSESETAGRVRAELERLCPGPGRTRGRRRRHRRARDKLSDVDYQIEHKRGSRAFRVDGRHGGARRHARINLLMPGPHDGFTLDSIAADAKTQVVAVSGTIAMTEACTLESQVNAGVRGGRTHVVLDLTAVAETGPGLLGALLRVRRGLTRVGGQLALVVDGPPVSELVATSLLARLVDVTADRVSALALVRREKRDRARAR